MLNALWFAARLLAVLVLTTAAPAPEEPPAPQSSAAVQQMLDEARKLLQAKQLEKALEAADRALVAAQGAQDLVGVAHAQQSRARALGGLGRIEEAAAAWQEAAVAWQRAGDGPGRVEGLVEAGLLLAAGKPKEADALLAQALALGRAASQRPRAAARALRAAGRALYDRRHLDQAREFYAAALALREKLMPNSLEVAASLNDLGSVAWYQGKLTSAEEDYRRALALGEKLDPNASEVATSLNGMGLVAYTRGDLARAKEFYGRALSLWEKQDPASLDTATGLNNLGLVAWRQGDHAAAAAYHRRALALREPLDPNGLATSTSLNNLGAVAFAQGKLDVAAEYYRRALSIKQRLAPLSMDTAAALNNLGNVMATQNDLDGAGEYYRRALAIKEKLAPNSLNLAATLGNLGTVAYKHGDLAAAETYHRRALTIQEKEAPDSLDMAGSLVNLGALFAAQGKRSEVSEYYRRALAINEKLRPNSLEMVANLTNLGASAYEQGDLVEAAMYHQRALAITERLAPNSLDVARSLYNLALVARGQGNLNEAERLASRAWELVRNQGRAVTGDEARQAFDVSTASYAANLLRFQIARGNLGPAFVTLEEARAQALQQLLFERRLAMGETETKLWSEYRIAVAARNRAEQAVSQASVAEALAERKLGVLRKERALKPTVDLAPVQAALDAAIKQRAEAQSAYTLARLKADALWAGIKKDAPRAFVPPLTLEQAQKVLPAGTLFVAFSVDEEQTHLFLLRSEAGVGGQGPGAGLNSSVRSPQSEGPISVYTVATTSKRLRALVDAFRKPLTQPDSDMAATVAASRALYAQLFPEAARRAIAGATRLLISPDGPLWDVSFAALVTNRQGPPKYLGADKAITYTQSLTLFAQSRSDAPRLAPGGKISAVVVGNPIFDRTLPQVARLRSQDQGPKAGPPNSKLETRNSKLTIGERSYLFRDGRPPAPLPATQKEASEIAKVYGGVLLTGEEATEATLRKWIETADVIHLATHGYMHPVRAMSSGVLLTVPEKEPGIEETSNDGVLQAWEVYSQLKLKAELVVLSGCETGRGENVRGEGLIGLTRALQYAGARSIIASQWKVDDESTRTLMVALHRNLRKGLAKDEALRQAMAVLRRNRKTAHPYDWAPFLLIGDPDNPDLGAELSK